jgi:hypothetical protein
MNKIRGQFGIIICRTILDVTKAEERQRNLKNDEKYVIVFTDLDIKKISQWKIEKNDEEIDNLLEGKFKKII